LLPLVLIKVLQERVNATYYCLVPHKVFQVKDVPAWFAAGVAVKSGSNLSTCDSRGSEPVEWEADMQ